MAPVVEDQCAPVPLLALPRIPMFVQRRAVEAPEAGFVPLEMFRHPVENNLQPGPVTGVHQQLEVLGATKPACRRDEPEHLVPPGPGERVLHDGQQLDVREAEVFRVRNESVGHLMVGEKAVALLPHARPGAEMDLVDRHRLVQPAAVIVSPRHPVVVFPQVARELVHYRRSLRRRSEREPERIYFFQQCAGCW